MFSMKHLLMGVHQVCSNKSPLVKIGPARGWGVGEGEGAGDHCFSLYVCSKNLTS
jgi:hypothetical protein